MNFTNINSKIFLFFLMLLMSYETMAQKEKYPVFEACEGMPLGEEASCFSQELSQKILNSIRIPQRVSDEGFKGKVNVVFLVTTDGSFKVLYANTPYNELKEELNRVFDEIGQVTPATFNNNPIEMRFVFPLFIPINTAGDSEIVREKDETEDLHSDLSVQSSSYPEHKSQLNIPFSRQTYLDLERKLKSINGLHSSMKPMMYGTIEKWIDLDEQKGKLQKNKTTWFGRKLFDEHMAFVQEKDFWFTIDPVVDLLAGKDNEKVKTYNNTRGIQINGGLGKQLNFSTSFYESQARFADFVNVYAESIRPDGGNPAIIPGRGIAKEFRTDSYDYPVAEAYLSYTPSRYFNFQFGHGKHFIGDGYRSLFLSDAASPYPFFKIATQFWKIHYTNLWVWGQDVRRDLIEDGAYRKKFMAMHYLSWNVSKRLNLGFFETVIWDNANDRGFDVNYVNPLIFYYSTEISTGTRAGNALMGLSAKYRLKSGQIYGQFIIDEFRMSEVGSGNGWWGNKNGLQLGAKWFDALGLEGLTLQAEYNTVRPFTYSHDELNYNYGHNNQPLAHHWGSNFREFVAIADYQQGRWFGSARLISGKKGFDFDLGSDDYSYGGNIFADNDNRNGDSGHDITQGNRAKINIADLQFGYLLNPATNLKLYTRFIAKNFDAKAPVIGFNSTNSSWIAVGLRTDLFDWNFDF